MLQKLIPRTAGVCGAPRQLGWLSSLASALRALRSETLLRKLSSKQWGRYKVWQLLIDERKAQFKASEIGGTAGETLHAEEALVNPLLECQQKRVQELLAINPREEAEPNWKRGAPSQEPDYDRDSEGEPSPRQDTRNPGGRVPSPSRPPRERSHPPPGRAERGEDRSRSRHRGRRGRGGAKHQAHHRGLNEPDKVFHRRLRVDPILLGDKWEVFSYFGKLWNAGHGAEPS